MTSIDIPPATSDLPDRDLTTKRIYGYRFKLAELEGRLKVGETGRTVKKRVEEQIKTAGLSDVVEILFNEPAIDDGGQPFSDTDVHSELLKIDGVTRLTTGGGREWFDCSLDQLSNAYLSVRTGVRLSPDRTAGFTLREEQKSAVSLTKAYFEESLASGSGVAPRFLWNAKMRFGKTFAAYHLAKEMGAHKVLIATFKPAVADAWQTDLETHSDFEGWTFHKSSDGEPALLNDGNAQIAYFSSFQDLFGTDPSTHTYKARHEWIANTEWDLVVFDEYHYGAWRYAEEQLVRGEDRGGVAELKATYTGDVDAFDEEFDEWGRDESEFLPFGSAKAFLYLSGTPFRALASGQFRTDQIFNWTYTDEQEAKATYALQYPNERNPYASLPEMHLLTYVVPPALMAFARGERNEFDLSSFFVAEGTGEGAEFRHKDLVQSWLKWMQGQDLESALNTVGSGQRFPYADTEVLRYLDHSVWFLPSVSSVFAMQNLLRESQNRSSWGEYDVRAVAGDSAGVGLDALRPVRRAIGTGYDTKTITLTCGKLLTGVTVPQWASILMLCNLSSPETYFQAAFRVQSSWTLNNPNGDDPTFERVEKPACLVIDFAPNRALSLYADYGLRLGNGVDPEEDLRELCRYLPVLAFEGASLRHVEASEVLDAALRSASVDVRRMESHRFINPRMGVAGRLDPSVSEALANIKIKPKRASGNTVPTIVNETPDVVAPRPGAVVAPEGVPDDHSEEANYDELVLRLQFLAQRINAFMYLSREQEKTLNDVLSTDETELFKLVMQLEVSQMRALVDAGLFNEAALRLAILEFSRAELFTLSEYTSMDPWSATGGANDA
jgi:hypothetical protein